MSCHTIQSKDNQLRKSPESNGTKLSKHSRKKHVQVVLKSNETPEWLPEGWIIELKTKRSGASIGKEYKVYIDLSTERKFYSKPEVLQYLKSVQCDISPVKYDRLKEDNVEEANELSEWLPKDWTVEVKARKLGGGQYKCYTNPSTGQKFYSKPEVLRHLRSGKEDSRIVKKDTENTVHSEKLGDTPNQNVLGHVKDMTQNISSSKKKKTPVGIAVSQDDLPPGWILKVKIKGKRRDKYYTDPECGYVFRSRLEVARYLENGVVGKYALKHMNSSIKASEKTPNGIVDNTTPEDKTQNLSDSANKQQLSAGNENSELLETENTCITRTTRASRNKNLFSTPTTKGSSDLNKSALHTTINTRAKKLHGSAKNSVGSTANRRVTRGSSKIHENLQMKNSPEIVIDTAEKNSEICDPIGSGSHESNYLKRKRGQSVDSKIKPDSVPVATEDPKKPINKKTEKKPSNVKKRKEFSFTPRSSKRLAVINSELTVQTPQVPREDKEDNSQDILPLDLVVDSVAKWASQPLNKTNTEFAQNARVEPINLFAKEPSYKSGKLFENQIISKNVGNLENEKIETGNQQFDPKFSVALENHMGNLDNEKKDNQEISRKDSAVLGNLFASSYDGQRNTFDEETSYKMKMLFEDQITSNNHMGNFEGGKNVAVNQKYAHEASVISGNLFSEKYADKINMLFEDQTNPKFDMGSSEVAKNDGGNQVNLSSNSISMLFEDPKNHKKEENPEPNSNFASYSWPDPCLEFAFKTLTEDNPAMTGFFQQQTNTSHNQTKATSGDAYGTPVVSDNLNFHTYFQQKSYGTNDFQRNGNYNAPVIPVTGEQFPMAGQHLPVKPSYMPSGNAYKPGFNDVGPSRPPGFENKKNKHGQFHHHQP